MNKAVPISSMGIIAVGALAIREVDYKDYLENCYGEVRDRNPLLSPNG
jgi:hypothetical protein